MKSMKKVSILILMAVVAMSIMFIGWDKSFAETSPANFGTNLSWHIDSSGKLIIEPAEGKTEGTLPNGNGYGGTSWAGSPPNPSDLTAVWPWYAYREDIKSIEIKSGVKGNNEVRYMFYNLPELTTADLKGLDASSTGVANDMFRQCSKLTEVTLPGTLCPAQMARAFQNCSALTTINYGTETDPINPKEVAEGRGSSTDLWNNIGSLFANCSSLKTLNVPNAELGTYGGTNNNNFLNFVNAFNSVNSQDKTLKMEGAKFSTWMSKRIFHQSNLVNLHLSGAEFNKTTLKDLFHTENTTTCDAKKLKFVDMSEVTFKPDEGSTGRTNALQMFTNMTALEEVILTGADFGNTQNFNRMFANSQALNSVKMDGNLNISAAVKMVEMFEDCRALETLDLSGFGVMENIVSMDQFVNLCTSLKVLNVSNMENSNIEPLRDLHPAKDTDAGAAAQNVDWSRDWYLDTCTKLEWLIADNSKVYMTPNKAGSNEQTYFAADVDSRLKFFTKKQIDFYKNSIPSDLDNPGDATVTIETKRDYIDIITDRTTLPDGSEGPDYDTNKNVAVAGHLNTSGAGFLAPGSYHILDKNWKSVTPPYQDTYYRIGNIKNSKPEVTLYNTTELESNGVNTIRTKVYNVSEWDSHKVIEGSGNNPVAEIRYPAAAVDINGKYHDIVVKINKIEFTHLDSIVNNPNRDHNNNKYVDTDANNQYYRPLVEYGYGKLQFLNYVRSSDGLNLIKGDSGTNIDFNITVDGALPNTSVLFYMDDLDIPANQKYTYPSNDACYDYLYWKDVTYAGYSEGIKLGDGNDLSTVKYADHSGLLQESNYIHGTGGDPSGSNDSSDGTTGWSAFSVKADAKSSNYTWTSGIGCTTDLLQATPAEFNPDDIVIKPNVLKYVNNTTPAGDYSNKFDFELVAAEEYGTKSIDYPGASGKLDNLAGDPDFDPNAVPDTKKNSAEKVVFNELTYSHPGSTRFDLNNGHTGANATGLPEGDQYDPGISANKAFEDDPYNEHIARAYIYRVREKIPAGTDTDILEYNTGEVTYFLKVIISNPKNDLEMKRGIKAEVTIGRYYGEETTSPDDWNKKITDADKIVWDEWSQTIWSADADERGTRQQEDRFVAWPKGSTAADDQYPVKVDTNGVEYVAVAAATYYNDPSRRGNVYLNANNPYSGQKSILIETVEGDVYPYEEQSDEYKDQLGHPDKVLSRPLKVEGKQVKTDVHGKMYISETTGSGDSATTSYYEVTKSGNTYSKGSKLDVKDGSFNPDAKLDKDMEVDWIIDGYQVRVDVNGQRYYKDSQGKYRDPGDDPDNPTSSELVVGNVGNVIPKKDDLPATKDREAGAVLVVNTQNHGTQVVYQTRDGDLYFKDGNNYYTIIETQLTEGQDGFNPNYPQDPDNPQEGEDKPYTTAFDIMVDEVSATKTVYYYKSDGKYFIYAPGDPENGKPYTPVNPGNVDHTKIDIGAFNNKVRKANITVEKNVVDNTGARITDGSRSGTFDYVITFKDSSGSAVDFNPTSYQFTPASEKTLTKLGTGKYGFTLDEDQKLVIYDVPFQTTYTVEEAVSDESGKETNLNGWEFVKLESTKDYDSEDPTDKTKITTTNSRSVEKTIVTDSDDEFYTHVFSNRYTEVLVDKVVKPASKDKEFNFTAEIKVTGLQPKMDFTYGYKDEDNNGVFKKGTTDAAGEADVSLTFTLKNKKDIALIVPQGATVKITEASDEDYVTKVAKDKESFKTADNISATGVQNPHSASDSKKPELHFTNTYIEPAVLAKDSIEVEKIIDGRSWKDTDKFNVDLEPRVTTNPLPEGHATDPVHSDVIITNADTEVKNGDVFEGYKDGYGSIKYSLKDMKKADNSGYLREKTFEYNIQEVDADISADVEEIIGITYDSSMYRVEVTVKLDETDTNAPKLKIDKCEIFKLEGNEKGEKVDIAKFTNTYDVNQTIHKMEAWKVLTDVDTGDDIAPAVNGYSFILKPIGDNAAIAPMPKKATGEGAARTMKTTNKATGSIDMQDDTDPDDGLKFNYQDLLAKGVSDAALHSDEGVAFEYEVYEEIPAGATNNNNGTWTLIDDRGDETIYDGIHHTRTIIVRVVTDDKGTADESDDELVLDVHSKADLGKGDFYIDKNGNEQPAEDIPGYVESDHHMSGGAPKFHNYYFDQKYAPILIRKVWDDGEALGKDNWDEIRPDSVTVNVKNDYSLDTLNRDVEITKSGDWKETLTDLPVYKFDTETKTVSKINYTLTEKQEGVINGNKETGYEPSYNHVMPINLDDTASEPFEVKVYNEHTPKPGTVGNDETYGLKGAAQVGSPNYSGNPKNPVTPVGLVLPDKTGATRSDDHKTVTIPGEGTYVLNSDGTITFTPDSGFVGNPTPVEVYGRDLLDNHVTGKYTPHVIDPIDEQKATRTVHFTYETKNGKNVVSAVTQTVTLTRHATQVDPKTGKVITWGPWNSATFPALKNPDKQAGKGYSTTDIAPALTVSQPGEVADVYVVYHKVKKPTPKDDSKTPKTKKKYTVTFLNGNHGKSDGGSVKRKYGTVPQKNNIVTNKGYRFTGVYRYVITDDEGNVIKRGKTKDPSKIKVIGNIVFTPIYEKVGKGGSPSTGDGTKIIVWILAASVCCSLLGVTVRKRR